MIKKVAKLRRMLVAGGGEVEAPRRQLFIVGCPRSGTTWVEQMFACHPRVITNRESHAFPRIDRHVRRVGWKSPSCRKNLLRDYREHKERSRAGLHNFISPKEYSPMIDEVIDWASGQETCKDRDFVDELVRRIFNRYCVNAGAGAEDVFVEKTPSHSLYVDRILRAFPDSRILHVLRDGRDVCVSMQFRAPHLIGMPEEREQQIERWVSYVSSVRRSAQKPKFEGRIATIRYEDIHADTPQALEKMFTFAGLEHSPESISQIISRTTFGKKSKSGPGRHSHKGVVGEWRKHFSPEDIRLYAEKAGDLHEQCGYSLDEAQAD